MPLPHGAPRIRAATRRRSRSANPGVAALPSVVVHAITAHYLTDPGCPWGYSALPAHVRLAWRFGDQISWRLVMIGLAESADEYAERGLTPTGFAAALRAFQRRYGMPFTFTVKQRVAGTSRACRAVIAAREIDPRLGVAALRALQLMQFTTTRLLDEDDDLRWALARVPDLDADAIVARIDDPDVVAAYERDKALARSAAGTPADTQGRTADTDGAIRYTAPTVIFEHANGRRVEVAGFQPFEAYDTALANLDPSLTRRPAPADVIAVLAELPFGLTTAEIASVMRKNDLDEPDLAATERQLTALAGDGKVICEPAAGDALWRLPHPGEATERRLAA